MTGRRNLPFRSLILAAEPSASPSPRAGCLSRRVCLINFPRIFFQNDAFINTAIDSRLFSSRRRCKRYARGTQLPCVRRTGKIREIGTPREVGARFPLELEKEAEKRKERKEKKKERKRDELPFKSGTIDSAADDSAGSFPPILTRMNEIRFARKRTTHGL